MLIHVHYRALGLTHLTISLVEAVCHHLQGCTLELSALQSNNSAQLPAHGGTLTWLSEA